MRKCFAKLRYFAALALCLITLGMLPCAAAETPTVTLRASFDAPQYAVGETATVSISALAADRTEAVAGFSFCLSAPDGMALQQIRMDPKGVFLRSEAPLGIAGASADTRRGAFCQVGKESLQIGKTEVVLAEAEYLVTKKVSGYTEITFDEVTFSASDGSGISVLSVGDEALVSGAVSSSDPVCTVLVDGVSDRPCMVGDTITVTLALCGTAESFSFCSMEDTITFDPACFSYVENSITASTGTAVPKTTGGVVDRIRFSVTDTEERTVTAGTTLVSFQLQVKKSGEICQSRVTLTDSDANPLPNTKENAAATVYSPEETQPVLWIGERELRNFSDKEVSVKVWLAVYAPDGRMVSVKLLAQETLAGGAAVSVSVEESGITQGRHGKLFVTGELMCPLAAVHSVW